ncbi:glycyl-tRNA synthetase [Breznakia sp. PF5-3]|uniref:glycine--tRNA ligase n=1 Tax=unclassified Breznakia TaxID=2623764 RepID=UPI002404AAB5|nr:MULTISPECIES: glycine--tRNA ligase [unclassified Breznakia]MDL2276121.1 glycine--tRNA ligase [Breznakia sp. OttesenSCG-928-G09]MDF9824431.1 glycyl-tRNA synthetase [Breznakia sp. PM6-1]MDF9835160.1 glycyl-tRNA synthetase [Breznakia sp. PF5-3]MDF9838315.1 glycyl-tRNA synthetase [Breznakia sp. PFB2-8]MDF9860331.1 glycyl-tRNA synthetase [Breznakia sp. PH5-24]
MNEKNFEKVVAHMKNTGFVFQGSEIYGGLSNTWDFGPIGIEFKNNIKNAWWKKFIQEDPNNVGIQSAILMNPDVWVASGHVGGFSDPLMDCKKCKSRFRADQLIENFSNNEVNPSGWSKDEMKAYIDENKIACPHCGAHDFTDIREFNLMFKTYQGVVEDSKSTIYLRPETAQGMFVNFKNVQRSMRKKLPFGIGQIGKSFRNEITPGNFIFRTREFEQMELEFFVKPGEDLKWYEYYKDFCMNFLVSIGIQKENLRLREHEQDELSHYSKGTSDIEYLFSFGWGELWGIADRTDFDLKSHQDASKKSLEYQDPQTNEKYIPYCIEPAVGVERMMLAVMCDAYEEEALENDETRTVLHLHPYLAPYKACILPLSKQLSEEAKELFAKLASDFAITYDEAGSIGKRYRRQDEIGTPFCITYDFDSKEDACVTIRDRDTMKQERVKISELNEYIKQKINF